MATQAMDLSVLDDVPGKVQNDGSDNHCTSDIPERNEPE